MDAEGRDRVIQDEVVVEAGLDAVWDAWTTSEGIKSFFAPACSIDLRVDGAYEMLFDPGAEPGSRGGEGVRILAIEPKTMLSFTWNAPPHLANVRKQWTHVVIRLEAAGAGRTRVRMIHDGWGEGEEWDQAFEYFTRAWKQMVLPRLRYRFSTGPVDWENPPRFE
ncbi:MAG: SRPBCC domain-containing protein [Candidatus Eisenbacteria bacterium]